MGQVYASVGLLSLVLTAAKYCINSLTEIYFILFYSLLYICSLKGYTY